LFPAGRSEPTSSAKHGEAHDRIPSVMHRAGLVPQPVHRTTSAQAPPANSPKLVRGKRPGVPIWRT
jgi:hypothetical protein